MMKSTKMLPSALLASVVLAVALSAQTNPDNPKFSLTIKADKPEVSLGSEIVFGITTTNLSDGPLVFDFGHQGEYQSDTNTTCDMNRVLRWLDTKRSEPYSFAMGGPGTYPHPT